MVLESSVSPLPGGASGYLRWILGNEASTNGFFLKITTIDLIISLESLNCFCGNGIQFVTCPGCSCITRLFRTS